MRIHTKIAIGIVASAGLVAVAGTAITGKDWGHHRGGHMGAIFEMLDADRDGKVTRAEAEAFRDAQFAKFDADSSGELNPDEYVALMEDFRRQMMRARFEKRDTDGNGGISKDELSHRLERMFDHMDRDNDGAIEKGEFRRGRHHDGDDGESGGLRQHRRLLAAAA